MRPVLSLFFLTVAAISAAEPRAAAPLLGFVYDSGALHPLRGIPGAALVDDPVGLDGAITFAAVSPAQDFALAVSASDSLLRVLRLGSQSSAAPLENGAPSVDRVLFSPTGAAALLHAAGGWQLAAGLPDAPAVRDLPLDDSQRPLAIADDGETLLVAGPDDTLSLLDRGTPIPLPFPAAAAAFQPATRDFLAAGRTGALVLVRDAGASWQQVRPDDAASAEPVGVAFSSDATVAYLASAAGRFSVVDLSTGDTRAVDCGFPLTGLEPLNARALFRLTGAGGPPLWIVDAAQPAPRLWFVPRRSAR